MVDRKTATSHTHTDKLSCLVLLSFLVFFPLSLTHKHSASFLVDLFLLSLPQSCALAFSSSFGFSIHRQALSLCYSLLFPPSPLLSPVTTNFRCFALLFTKISLQKTPSPPKKGPQFLLPKWPQKLKKYYWYLSTFLPLSLSLSFSHCSQPLSTPTLPTQPSSLQTISRKDDPTKTIYY